MAKKKTKNKSNDFIKIEEKIKNKEEDKKIDDKKIIKEERLVNKVDTAKNKTFKHPFIHSFLVIVLLVSLIYFIISLFYNNTDSLVTLISSLLLSIFTLLFVSSSITTNRKNKNGFFLGSFVLLCYFVFSILVTMGIINFSENEVIDFTEMELTEVIKWSEKNKVDIVQDYEYSDMISEYHIISQDVKSGTKIKDVESITVVVSEGPNPTKEVIIPNMITWDSERVLNFIKNNYLSNVDVEFVESTKLANTVIEQSKSGNIQRNEELKITFSYGADAKAEEIKLRDLSGMSKFEATFYLKQNTINYVFEDVFSSKVKRGYVVTQNIKAGTTLNIKEEKLVIRVSKGPEIKIPNLKGMSMTEITEWVVKNKLKLEFTDKYDDTIDENSVISANYKEGEIVEVGTVIEVIISRGQLTMPKFETYQEFRDWAEKYEIQYDEHREFSNDVKAGEAIRYSYNTGEVIKNNDHIMVIVSNGKEATVPNVVGSTKAQATTKLNNAGFGYSFVYSYSSSVAKGNVIKQSISAGSKVAQGTTITVTISNGPKPANSTPNTPSTPSTPTCDTSKGAIFYVGIGGNGADALSATKKISSNSGFTITATFVDQCSNGDSNSGAVCNSSDYDDKWISYCTPIKLIIVR